MLIRAGVIVSRGMADGIETPVPRLIVVGILLINVAAVILVLGETFASKARNQVESDAFESAMHIKSVPILTIGGGRRDGVPRCSPPSPEIDRNPCTPVERRLLAELPAPAPLRLQCN